MKTIRGRLLAMLLSGLGVVLIAGGAGVYLIQKASLLRQFDAGLAARAHTLVSLVKLEPDGLIFESSDAPSTVAETYFELRTRAGKMLKHSSNLGETSLRHRELAEHELAFDDTPLPGQLKGRAVWLAFRPRIDPDDWIARDSSQATAEILVVTAAMERSPIDGALATLLVSLAVVGALVGLAVAVLVAVGVRWGLAPIERLSRQLGDVTDTTMSQRFDGSKALRELAPIYRELNGMMDRVQRTLERERSFADGAAHELRTPLAELRTLAEVAVKWPDAQRTTATLNEVLAIGREMERLVESLLMISRSNAATSGGSSERAAVAPIVQGCVRRAAESIEHKGLTVAMDLDEDQTLSGTPDALEIIIRNLIDNAVRYTPASGSIAIRTRGSNGIAGNGSMSLIVENGPVDLNPADLPRLFEPFWRSDRSRTDRQHAGLGLTIVDQIARTMGLQVNAALEGDRLEIRVSDGDK